MPRRKNKAVKSRLEGPVQCNPAKRSKLCDNSVKLQVGMTSSDTPYKFGNVIINLHKLHEDVTLNAFTLQYLPESKRYCVYWKEERNNAMQVKTSAATCDIPYDVFENLAIIKIFQFQVKSHALHHGFNIIEISIKPSSFISLKCASEPYFNHHRGKMYRLIQYFFNIKFYEYDDSFVYEKKLVEDRCIPLNNQYDSSVPTDSVSHEFLIPSLRPYQSQAVTWMLKQENVQYSHESDLHVLYTALNVQDTILYFHKYGGFFVNEKYAPEKLCKGGILADEMGLGKTIEVLACILLNPRSDLKMQNKVNSRAILNNVSVNSTEISEERQERNVSIFDDEHLLNHDSHEIQDTDHFECVCGDQNSKNCPKSIVRCVMCNAVQHAECILYQPKLLLEDYICPYCCTTKCNPVASRATLIISPASIIQQWDDEISKHIQKNSLKVFMYKGVEHQKFIEPTFLADHDIILTSYETLKKELNYVDLPHGDNCRSFRHPKKFISIPSPMCSIEWWRICLDEAQMVESVSSKIAKMAGKLHGINRWCVTGTPIKKSFEDLYGLLVFLGMKPYDEKLWWKEVLWKPFVNGEASQMTDVFQQIFWRTTKERVLDQIEIPVQEEFLHELKFTAIEKVFYDREHACCRRAFKEKTSKFQSLDVNLSTIDRHELSKVMLPLRKLQASCCLCIVHKNGDQHRISMTPVKLLEHLLKTTKYECEDIHRKMIMSMSGLAGIYVLQDNFKEAVDTYENAVKSIEDNKLNFRTDVTQKIHCLHQLSFVLSHCEKNGRIIESTYQSSDLDTKVKELTVDYMVKCKAAVENSKKHAQEVRREIKSIMSEFKLKRPGFPTSVWSLSIFENLNEEKEILLQKIEDALNDAPGRSILHYGFFKTRIRACDILPKLSEMIEDLYDTRATVLHCVKKMSAESSDQYFKRAILCHLRPESSVKVLCIYCKTDNHFKKYESKLFRFDTTMTNKETDEEENICFSALRRGIHADGDLEIILKFLLKFCRQKGLDCIEDATNEVQLLDALKREFKCLRRVWLKCVNYVSQKDEIEMAKISKRLIDTSGFSEPPQFSAPYIVYSHELIPKMLMYEANAEIYNNELSSKLGQLFYLRNLEKAGENKDAPFEEICPICQQTFGNAWSVLVCGHNFCLTCMETLSKSLVPKRNAMGVIKYGIQCAVCRQFTPDGNIYYSDKKAESKDNVKGDYSTKVREVIKCLLKINEEDPAAKSLVFSSFIDFLLILDEALKWNNIRCLSLCKRKTFQEHLLKFKQDRDVKVLLIPLTLGCSGLNITEASNVLLVEPDLDESKHLQAIGRIHRIGQTKKTTVHRFFISNSVEENVLNMKDQLTMDPGLCNELTLARVSKMFLD